MQQLFLPGALAIGVVVFTYSKGGMMTVGRDLAMSSPIAAFVVVIMGLLVPMWSGLPRLVSGEWPRHVRNTGLCAMGLLALLPLALLANARLVHHIVVFGAGATGLGAAILMTLQLWRTHLVPTWVTYLGAAALAASVVDIGIYALQLTAHHEPAVIGPSLQKVALILILLWLPAVGTHLESITSIADPRARS